jgi:hypothetical protein
MYLYCAHIAGRLDLGSPWGYPHICSINGGGQNPGWPGVYASCDVGSGKKILCSVYKDNYTMKVPSVILETMAPKPYFAVFRNHVVGKRVWFGLTIIGANFHLLTNWLALILTFYRKISPLKIATHTHTFQWSHTKHLLATCLLIWTGAIKCIPGALTLLILCTF